MIELIQKYASGPTSVNVATGLEKLIRSGDLPADTLLPPVRTLALALQVSPGTAAAAYKALKARGLVTADGRRGTRTLTSPAFKEYADAPLPTGAMDLQVANPDPALLPDLRRAWRQIDPASGDYGGAHLEPALRAWAEEAFDGDGIDASHLVVTAGATAALDRALGVALEPGDKIAVEDPGFNDHHALVLARRMAPVPVSVDDDGMRPESLRRALKAGAAGVILTPRCQSPLGAAFTGPRAAAVRVVLSEFPRAFVFVDDYAGLLTRVAYRDVLGRGRARWLVARSFNKALAPDVRAGVAAGDAETVDRLRREQGLRGEWVSAYLQRVAARVLASREGQASLVRAQRAYDERRITLLRALSVRGIPAHGASGMNVWVPVVDEASAVNGMAARGWGIRPGARYRLVSGPAVRITISRMPVDRAPAVADDLRACLRPSAGSAP
jgi:DNA-binding transcriptional MocR family regulator